MGISRVGCSQQCTGTAGAFVRGAVDGAANLLVELPASDQVTLRFASRHASSSASLAVYDVGGRLVTHVTDVPHDGIIRTASWYPDGRPPGVYFAVLRAGRDQVSRKITLR